MARAQVRAPAPDDQDQQAAGDDNEAPEAQGDSSDSPILDLSDAAVKRMIKTAKKRGFVTHDELNAVLPSEEVSSDQIEDIYAMLNEMGINVVDNEEAEEGEAEEEGAHGPHSVNWTERVKVAATGSPQRTAGSKRHRRTASSASPTRCQAVSSSAWRSDVR